MIARERRGDEEAKPRQAGDKPGAAAEPSEASTRLRLTGRRVVDRDGNELGTVDAVHVDDETDAPAWALVTASRGRGRRDFVPLVDAVIEDDRVRVGYGKAWVRAAPSFDADEGLSASQEDRLLDHYGLSRYGPRGPNGVSTSTPDPAPVSGWPPNDDEIVAARPAPTSEHPRSDALLAEDDAIATGGKPPGARRATEPSAAKEGSGSSASEAAHPPLPHGRVYRGFSLRAAFLGWLSAIGLLALLGTLVGGFLGSTSSAEAAGRSVVSLVALVLIVLTSYFVGGYVAGRIARTSGARQGFGVWAVAVAVAVALALLSAVAGAPLNLLAAVGFPRLLVDGDSIGAGAAIALAAFVGSLVAAVVGGKLGAHLRRATGRTSPDRGSTASVPDQSATEAGANEGGLMASTAVGRAGNHAARRTRETETKASYKTSELIVYVLVVIGILIASNVIDRTDGAADWFRADEAWLYITIVTVGYLISRGLAKSGSRDPYEGDGGNGGGGIGERLGAAVEAFREEPGAGAATEERGVAARR